MTKALIISLLIATGCSSLKPQVASQDAELKYKKGDKIEFWSVYGPSQTCEVLYGTSNPYSAEPMTAKYEVSCPDKFHPTGFNTRTVTSKDISTSEYMKAKYVKEHPNWEKEIAASEARMKPKYKPDYNIGDSVTYYDTHEDTTSKCKVVKLDDPGLGKSQIGYILECEGHDNTIHAEASLLKAGRKIASDRAAGKGMTREQSFKETVKRTIEQRKQTIKTLNYLAK